MLAALVSLALVLPFQLAVAGTGAITGSGKVSKARPSVTVTRTVTTTATATVTATVTATATATVTAPPSTIPGPTATTTVTVTAAAPSASATPTSSSAPTATPTVTSPTSTATSTPAPTPTPTATTTPAADGFPTVTTAGVPVGWVPTRSVTGDYVVSTAGALVQDLRITNGDLLVRAPNVTIRRVQILGGIIHNEGNSCFNGLTIEDTSIARAPGQVTRDTDPSAVMVGGYTARNVSITGLPEGFRVGGDSVGCGPVVIEDSYVHVVPPDVCNDWHGDALQGYDGPALTLRNTVLRMTLGARCGATSPFFYPSGQGNTKADIDGLVVDGGGYPFRMGTPGTVRNLHILDRSWVYGPLSVACPLVSSWQASVSSLGVDGQPVAVRSQACNTTDGA